MEYLFFSPTYSILCKKLVYCKEACEHVKVHIRKYTENYLFSSRRYHTESSPLIEEKKVLSDGNTCCGTVP